MINHPHFDVIEMEPDDVYRNKSSGLHVVLLWDGYEVRALPVCHDGKHLGVHSEPVAWGETEWEVLDAIHAQR